MAKEKRTRPAANLESETAPARPRTFRRIIPAEPADAFWEFSKLLSDLLFWATDTVPQPLNVAWREKYKDSIKDVADSTIRSAKTLGDDSLVAKIQKAQRLGFEFATLLCDRPALSTVAVENWTVPRYRQLFNDLSALEREFKLRGDGELPTPSIKPSSNKGHGDLSPPNIPPKGVPGRKSAPAKVEHAKWANELLCQLPRPPLKSVAATVNEQFNLTGADAYSDEQIRGLHRYYHGDKAQKKKRV